MRQTDTAPLASRGLSKLLRPLRRTAQLAVRQGRGASEQSCAACPLDSAEPAVQTVPVGRLNFYRAAAAAASGSVLGSGGQRVASKLAAVAEPSVHAVPVSRLAFYRTAAAAASDTVLGSASGGQRVASKPAARALHSPGGGQQVPGALPPAAEPSVQAVPVSRLDFYRTAAAAATDDTLLGSSGQRVATSKPAAQALRSPGGAPPASSALPAAAAAAAADAPGELTPLQHCLLRHGVDDVSYWDPAQHPQFAGYTEEWVRSRLEPMLRTLEAEGAEPHHIARLMGPRPTRKLRAESLVGEKALL